MDAKDEAGRGLTDIEDFLYWEAHHGASHRRAADLASHVPGLDSEQTARIECWYVEEQDRVARHIAQHVADHVSAVEKHHTNRYARLRRDAYLAVALVVGVMFGLLAALIFAAT
ncbi:hypothetical protein [Streptomyces sp. ADI93-02]|uniref:hypothetical protein n=1 Tax=Streptomyces sp. ADI93-02 TaxID=1522757 RepID=UPI000F556B9D|nr:hypothetical protein [Streptomyces sp. ADI93-02]RPK32127.1 hypothetical protein EES40_36735 [Streptomyces sp. ADI93-02]